MIVDQDLETELLRDEARHDAGISSCEGCGADYTDEDLIDGCCECGHECIYGDQEEE